MTRCRGIVIAGTHSGVGKTTVTLGILAALMKKNYKVQAFKAGPDFIDTGLLKLITGRNSRNLDLWMCGKDYVRECFKKHSADADIAVVEGVMGLYDGNQSTAEMSSVLNLTVVLVIDAYGMAESAGAVVKGFKEYKGQRSKEQRTKNKDNLKFAGVIFNRVSSDRHYKRLKDSVQDVPVLGYLPRNVDFEIPHRHLGLVVAEEEPITLKVIDKLADTVLEHINIEAMFQNTDKSPPTHPSPSRGEGKGGGENLGSVLRALGCKIKIGIAYDRAFCFYYEDNFDLLRKEGAEIITFSPLSDSKIPDDIDALYIGGGYPELYAEALSNNKSMLESVNDWTNYGRPVYAECGGFMYLTEGIYDFDNVFYPMVGIFPLRTKMTRGRAKLGYRKITLKYDSIIGEERGIIRGHEFHYSEITDRTQNKEHRAQTKDQRTTEDGFIPSNPRILESSNPDLIYSVKDSSGEDIQAEGYRVKNTLGSYIHIHFGSNPLIAENFIKFCKKERYGSNSTCRAR